MTRRRFWSLRPSTAREVADAIFANFLLHWFPARMRASSLAWLPTFWLGTASWVLFVVLLLSGVPLMVFYIPSVEDAYRSVKDIEHVVSFGWWLRAVHRLGAHLMVITVTLHLARVFLTGAYKNAPGGNARREWNWVIGVAMLFGTLLLSFTGYLLPWDQLAFWAVTVGTSIVSSAPVAGAVLRETLIGGREIGEATLVRFYLLHIIALPIAVAVLFGYHMWRVRKDGGLAHGGAEDERAEVPAIPPVVRRIAVVTMATVLTVTVLAAFIPSPLLDPANPDDDAEPCQGPVVLPVAAGSRGRHDRPARARARERGARRRRCAATGALGRADPVAVAGPIAGKHGRRGVSAGATHPERRLPDPCAGDHRLDDRRL